MELREVTALAVVIRILAAVGLGGVIGLERGLKNRPAGLRTYMLVCVGACLIMLTNQYIYQSYGTGDPVRMGAQVVSGIGFLGAGTIVVTKRNQIRGLTTAAGLWASAAVGLAVGIGFYEAALMGGGVIFLVLTLIHNLDSRMHSHSRLLDVYVELSDGISLGNFMRKLNEMDLEIQSTQLEPGDPSEPGTRAFFFTLRSREKRSHALVLESIRTIEGVTYLEEL